MSVLQIARQARRIGSDERGLALVEMSLILPVLVLLICGSVDLALCYARQLTLQQIAARTMELAISVGATDTLATTIQNEAATAAGLATSNVTSTVWLECNGVVQASGTTTCATGSPARYASVTISDTYNWMFEQIVPTWNHAPYSVNVRGFAEVRLQ